MIKARTSDWVEDLTEPTFGVLRPPLYAYKHNDGYYIFYPVLIDEHDISIGPAFVPVIPMSLFPKSSSIAEEQYLLSIRCWNENGSQMPVPQKIFLVNDGNNIAGEELTPQKDNTPGLLHTYKFGPAISNLTAFTIHVMLDDGHEISVDYASRIDTWVAPFFSFNEPPKKPFVKIKK